MKKLTVLCLILLLLMQVFSSTVVFAAEEIKISSCVPSKKVINETDVFDIDIYFTGTISDNATITIDTNCSFYRSSSNDISPKLSDIKNTTTDGVTFYRLENLRYNGTGRKLILKYKDGADLKYLYYDITQVNPTEVYTPVLGSQGVDTSAFVPRLIATNVNDTMSVVAGESKSTMYNIRNDSNTPAYSVMVTMKMADEAKSPLVFEDVVQRVFLGNINSNTSKDVFFAVTALKTAPAGVYAMKLDYEYKNAFGNAFNSSETVYIKVVNDSTEPTLTVNNVNAIKTGDSVIELKLEIGNIGSMPANKIKFSLSGLKSGGYTLNNGTDVKYITKLDGGDKASISYQLSIPVNAAAAGNELSLKMEYSNDYGTAYTETNQIFIPLGENNAKNPTIAINNISASKKAVGPNEDFNVKMTLHNNGGMTAKKIKITLDPGTGIVSRTMNPAYLDKLEAGGSSEVSFTLFALEDAATKNYPLAINVEYEDEFGNKQTASQYMGVYVENSTTSKANTVPRIIVSNYSLDPTSVSAGETFKLSLTFLNTSKKENVSNIKVTVKSEDGTFTPSGTGNTFFIEGIPIKASADRELLMTAKPDAEQKSYPITVNFEYEDSKGNPYTSSETISVSVIQNPRLFIGDLSVATEAYVGQPFYLYADFYNMGKSTLYNLMVKADGDFGGQDLNYYVGNFAPGSTDSFDTQVIPNTAGEMKGSIVFSFEDANGKISEIRKDFSTNVIDMAAQQGGMLDENGMPIDMKDGMMPEAPPAKKSIWFYIVPAAVLLVLIILLIIFLRKRQARRKEMTLDE